jgi:hypothetical protein
LSVDIWAPLPILKCIQKLNDKKFNFNKFEKDADKVVHKIKELLQSYFYFLKKNFIVMKFMI